MPFNGSGTFSRLYSWVVDAANSVNISSSRTDAEMNGFAAGLTNCVTRDGQSPPSTDLPWGGKRLTNLGAATAGTDALNRDTADARYIQSVTAAPANFSVGGNLTVTGGETVGGVASAVGVQVRYNAGLSKAIVQFTTADGSSQLGTVETDNASAFTFNCTSLNVAGIFKIGGNVAWNAANLNAAALNTIYGYTPADAAAVSASIATLQPLTPRVQSLASATTVTPTTANDEVVVTAQAVALTLANPTGTPVQGQGIVIRVKDNATPQTIAYGTQYRAVGLTLPTTTVASKQLYLGILWNADDTKWDVVSVAQQ